VILTGLNYIKGIYEKRYNNPQMIIKVLFEYVVGTYILLIRLAAMMHSIEMEIIGVPVE